MVLQVHSSSDYKGSKAKHSQYIYDTYRIYKAHFFL